MGRWLWMVHWLTILGKWLWHFSSLLQYSLVDIEENHENPLPGLVQLEWNWIDTQKFMMFEFSVMISPSLKLDSGTDISTLCISGIINLQEAWM
jgi:hypothetical protein